MTPKNKVEEALAPLMTKPEWITENVWSPAEMIVLLNSLSPEQSAAAKVIHYEVKIMIVYPKAKQVDTVEGF